MGDAHIGQGVEAHNVGEVGGDLDPGAEVGLRLLRGHPGHEEVEGRAEDEAGEGQEQEEHRGLRALFCERLIFRVKTLTALSIG